MVISFGLLVIFFGGFVVILGRLVGWLVVGVVCFFVVVMNGCLVWVSLFVQVG